MLNNAKILGRTYACMHDNKEDKKQWKKREEKRDHDRHIAGIATRNRSLESWF